MLSLAHVPGPCLAKPFDEMMRAPAPPALNYLQIAVQETCTDLRSSLELPSKRPLPESGGQAGLGISMKGFLFILTITPGLTLAGCLSAYES